MFVTVMVSTTFMVVITLKGETVLEGILRQLQLHKTQQNFAFASNYLPPLVDDKTDVWMVWSPFILFSPQWTGFSQN